MSLSSTTALILLPTVVNGLLTSTGQRGRSTWFREDEAGSCLRVQLLGHLRAFCRWMVEQDWLVSDPSKRIPNPRKPQQLPKAILDETEVASILAQPDLRTATGYRDRVILEVLYSRSCVSLCARHTSVVPSRPTRFATVARRTCCALAHPSGICRKCWVMPRLRPRRFIPE